MEKIWIITETYNVNGEIINEIFPCKSAEIAEKVFEKRIQIVNETDNHFKNYLNETNDQNITVDQSSDYFFICDNDDLYTVLIKIQIHNLIS